MTLSYLAQDCLIKGSPVQIGFAKIEFLQTKSTMLLSQSTPYKQCYSLLHVHAVFLRYIQPLQLHLLIVAYQVQLNLQALCHIGFFLVRLILTSHLNHLKQEYVCQSHTCEFNFSKVAKSILSSNLFQLILLNGFFIFIFSFRKSPN